MRLRLCAALLISELLFASANGASPDEAPLTPPKGFATYEDARKAVVSGQVPLITAPTEVPVGIEETKDLEYGNINGRGLQLDLYRPKELKHPVPALIFVHGGGWYKGNRQDYRVYAIDFAKRGYVAATISYRLSDEAKFPAQVEDAKCAVRWIRANAAKYSIDPKKIAAIGGSAGGHLSLMLGTTAGMKTLEGNGGNAGTSSAVQAVVDFYGPADLTTELGKTSDIVKRFFGATYDEKKADYELASPLLHVDKSDPPTLVLHGTVDELVPVEQSDLLVAAFKAAGVPVEYERLEGWPHSMDIAQTVNAYCQQQMAGFLKKYLPIEP